MYAVLLTKINPTEAAFENLRVPNVAPQRVHALVPRLIGHLEDRRAARSNAGQKAVREFINHTKGVWADARPTRKPAPDGDKETRMGRGFSLKSMG